MTPAHPTPHWPALSLARQHTTARVPLHSAGRPLGSVAGSHLEALLPFTHWVQRDPATQAAQRLKLNLPDDPASRDAALADINTHLHRQGLIRAWRDETFGLLDPATGESLALMERAACRFWGTLTRGAHCNGYVCTDRTLPERPTHLWIARRSFSKATDPGKLDNLVGGGVPFGQTPHETLMREGWEEAGLTLDIMRGAKPATVLRIDCDVPEGRMVEDLHAFDLALPVELQPRNQDGEVAELHLLTIDEALRRAAAGEMTTDAALVTLDFALRHALLAQDEAAELGPALRALHSPSR